MTRDLVILVGGTATLWVMIGGTAWLIGGNLELVFAAVGALVCLAPSAATLIWARKAFAGSPEKQLAAVLGGMAVRMTFVIAVGLLLYFQAPLFDQTQFLLWLVGFYLVTLALEVIVLVRGGKVVGEPHQA